MTIRSLVQPVLDSQCVACHKPGTDGAKLDLTAEKSYETLLGYGKPSLRDHVMARYMAGRSIAGPRRVADQPAAEAPQGRATTT